MLTMRRILHDFLGSLYLYGVLKYEIPAIVVDSMSDDDFKKSGLTPMGPAPDEPKANNENEEESKEEDTADPDAPKPLRFEAELTTMGVEKLLIKTEGVNAEEAKDMAQLMEDEATMEKEMEEFEKKAKDALSAELVKAIV